jgi:preprotein translocase subunit SecG
MKKLTIVLMIIFLFGSLGVANAKNKHKKHQAKSKHNKHVEQVVPAFDNTFVFDPCDAYGC